MTVYNIFVIIVLHYYLNGTSQKQKQMGNLILKKMKMDKIIALLIASLIAFAYPVTPRVVESKINLLCYENPEIPCTEIVDYCREALEEGQECYLIN